MSAPSPCCALRQSFAPGPVRPVPASFAMQIGMFSRASLAGLLTITFRRHVKAAAIQQREEKAIGRNSAREPVTHTHTHHAEAKREMA